MLDELSDYVVLVDTLVDRNAAVAQASLVLIGETDEDRSFIATGSAKREPGDPWSTVGEQLAIARALHNLASLIKKDAQSRIPQVSPSYLKSLPIPAVDLIVMPGPSPKVRRWGRKKKKAAA